MVFIASVIWPPYEQDDIAAESFVIVWKNRKKLNYLRKPMVFNEYNLKKLNYLRKPMVFIESDMTWAEKAEETNGFHCVWAATNRKTLIIIWLSMVSKHVSALAVLTMQHMRKHSLPSAPWQRLFQLYIHIYTCIHNCIHTYIYVYIYIYECVHICIAVFLFTLCWIECGCRETLDVGRISTRGLLAASIYKTDARQPRTEIQESNW